MSLHFEYVSARRIVFTYSKGQSFGKEAIRAAQLLNKRKVAVFFRRFCLCGRQQSLNFSLIVLRETGYVFGVLLVELCKCSFNVFVVLKSPESKSYVRIYAFSSHAFEMLPLYEFKLRN